MPEYVELKGRSAFSFGDGATSAEALAACAAWRIPQRPGRKRGRESPGTFHPVEARGGISLPPLMVEGVMKISAVIFDRLDLMKPNARFAVSVDSAE